MARESAEGADVNREVRNWLWFLLGFVGICYIVIATAHPL